MKLQNSIIACVLDNIKHQKNMIKNLSAVTCSSLMVLATATAPYQKSLAQSGNGDLGFAGTEICTPGLIDIPQILSDAPKGDNEYQPTNIEGDEIQTEGDNIIKLLGNAQVVQGDRGVFADEIDFNKDSYAAGAKGNVIFYTGNGDEISAEELELEVDTFIGTAQNATMRFADDSPYFTTREHYNFEENYSMFAPFRNKTIQLDSEELEEPVVDDNTYVRARATAETIDFEGKEFQTLHNATLTTCAEGDNSVLLSAKQIELDHIEGIGTAENMTVKFKKVPIFYFPKVSFPINDQRKTGFLFPGIGYEKESGYIIEVPYYINIDPQYDATITPRVLSHRGFQLFGEFRYLTERSKGDIRAEYLPGDNVFDDDRHAISFFNETKFNDDWEADIDLQDVSDTRYLTDFSSDVDVASATYIPQRARVDYFGDIIRFRTELSAYERVNQDVSISGQPYERLPRVMFNVKEQDLGLFAYGLDSEVVNYSHDDSTRVDGTRLRIKPYLGMPLEEIYGYLKPMVSFQSISYSLDNNPTGDSSPREVMPIASIDSKLIFERLIKRPENIYLQTLEPRLFYVNIPDELDQEDFPNFDTADGSSSSFSHFFRKNRFFGGDRVGDTEQLSVGLTSRFINDDSGLEKFKISIGQVFYFADREVGLTANSEAETDDNSDFLAEISGNVTDDWSLRGFGRWAADDNNLDYVSFSADYFHSNRRSGSISYSSTDEEFNSSEQLNLRVEAPLGAKWQSNARVDYSLEDSEIRSSEIGLAYDGCCWALGFVAQRYLSRGDYKNRFIVTFELDDLGKLSSSL